MSKISETAMEFVCTTASPFVLLQLESDIKSESGEDRSGQGAGISQASEDICSTNEKKRKKRRRKKKQQQSGVSELTSEMFEADLEKALLLSKLEHEEHKKEYENIECTSPQSKSVNKKGKRKNQQGEDKPLTVSLKDFQSDNSIDSVAKKHETLMNDGGFFHKLEGDVHKILKREKRRNQLTDCNEIDDCTSHEHNQESGMKDGKTEQLKLELEKKDAEIQQLKNIITQREAKYKKAKARNAQLKMLQEGEMKDKAEILLLVDELHILKNELTLQVTTLHATLEQERSKVKLLQAELTKYQSEKRGKKRSQSD